MTPTPLPMNTVFMPRARQLDVARRPTATVAPVLAAITVAVAGALVVTGGPSSFGMGVAAGLAMVLGGVTLAAFLLRFGQRRTHDAAAEVPAAWPSASIDTRALLCIHQALHTAQADHGLTATTFAAARVRWRATDQGPTAEEVILYPVDHLTLPIFLEPTGVLAQPVPWTKAPRGTVAMANLLESLHGTTTLVKLTPLASAHGRLAFAAWAQTQA